MGGLFDKYMAFKKTATLKTASVRSNISDVRSIAYDISKKSSLASVGRKIQKEGREKRW